MTINAVHVDCFPSCHASCCRTRSALRKNKELPKCRLAARHSPNHRRWCFPTDNPSTDLMLIRTRVAGACILSLCLYGGNKHRTKSSCLSSGKGTETHDPLMPPRIKRSILWCSTYAARPVEKSQMIICQHNRTWCLYLLFSAVYYYYYWVEK